MFFTFGLMMIGNGILSHLLLNKYSEYYKNWKCKEKHEMIGRINCCLYQLYILYQCYSSNSPEEYSLASEKFAYFMILDMFHYLFYVSDYSSYLHHILSLLSIFYINSNFAPEGTLYIFNHLLILFESTNPMMSISWMGNKFGYKNHILFKFLGSCSFFLWTYIRIFYLSNYIIYYSNSLINQIIMSFFLVLNLYWFKSLISVFYKIIKI